MRKVFLTTYERTWIRSLITAFTESFLFLILLASLAKGYLNYNCMEFYSWEKLKHVQKRDVYTENYILQLFYYYSILLLEQSTLEENAAFFSIYLCFLSV